MKYNYAKLMAKEPTVFETWTNKQGQKIDLVEHPIFGDVSYVICVCHELQLAEDSTFFDTSDMTSEHREYEPSFQDGVLYIGDSPAND